MCIRDRDKPSGGDESTDKPSGGDESTDKPSGGDVYKRQLISF